MSERTLSTGDALVRLGSSSADAVARALESYAPGSVKRGEVSVLAEGAPPFSGLPAGSVATSVSYVDGVTGANVFTVTPAAARLLTTAMGARPASEPGAEEDELSELELSAIGEAANQMMSAAGSAISVVLGQEIEVSPPVTRVLAKASDAVEEFGTASHAIEITFLLDGEHCRLTQLVPSTLVARLSRALAEESVDQPGGRGGEAGTGAQSAGVEPSRGLRGALGETNLRVWAELGRTRIPLGRALTLPLGAVVDLDRAADAPVDLFVNGLRFAHGHLLVTDEGEWAVRLEGPGEGAPAHQPPPPEQASTPPLEEGALS